MSTIMLGTQRGIRVLGEHDDASDLLAGTDITALSRMNGTTWAITDRHDVMRVSGQSAERLAHVEPAATCLLALPDTVWIGTEDAHLYRLDGAVLRQVSGFETAPSRSDWYTPWGGPADTRTIAAGSGRVFVNVHVGGILTSDDGNTWEPTLDLHTDVHQVCVGPDATIWAATGAAGLGESRDGGRSWTFHRAGLHGTYLRCAVPTDDGVLVTASSGPHARDGAVYRFDRERFHPCGGGQLPELFPGNLDTGCLAANGKTAVLGGTDGRVYISQDAGRSWTVNATKLPPIRAVVA